jgi:hypothetical protein
MSISKVEKLFRKAEGLPLPLGAMRLIGRLTAGVALAITICWTLALAFAGSTDALLFMAPALLLAAPLLAGRYVGEALIEKLAASWSPLRRRLASSPVCAPRRPSVWQPRGTSLLALSLATRPPPGALLPQT